MYFTFQDSSVNEDAELVPPSPELDDSGEFAVPGFPTPTCSNRSNRQRNEPTSTEDWGQPSFQNVMSSTPLSHCSGLGGKRKINESSSSDDQNTSNKHNGTETSALLKKPKIETGVSGSSFISCSRIKRSDSTCEATNDLAEKTGKVQ